MIFVGLIIKKFKNNNLYIYPNVKGNPAKLIDEIIRVMQCNNWFFNIPINLVSWVLLIFIIDPAQKKVIALNKPCKYKYTTVITKLFNAIDAKINPQWLIVEYANNFFISDCPAAVIPP